MSIEGRLRRLETGAGIRDGVFCRHLQAAIIEETTSGQRIDDLPISDEELNQECSCGLPRLIIAAIKPDAPGVRNEY